MLPLLARILLVLSVCMLIVRTVGGLLKALGSQRAGRGRPVAGGGPMVRDPVCGMYLDARLALRQGGPSEPVYFCSDECARKFAMKR
jgi:YHS domain-containing protein